MATCMDCIHFNICNLHSKIIVEKDSGGIDWCMCEDVENHCFQFKNKADFVEVVRCKDCKHAKAVMHRGEEMPGIFKCTYLKPNTTLFDIDFCRYGKREEKK